MEFIDLHVHTTASDGSLSPEQIVESALEKGLYAVAITDHDTVAGIPRAVSKADGYPISVIPGIEFSSQYNGLEVHVLGYNIDIKNPVLTQAITDLAALRNHRNARMCELLAGQGIDITLQKIYEMKGQNVITRADIAIYLLDKGYVSSVKEAFDRFIGEKCCCYVPRYKMSISDAYSIIRQAGGTASLAHPVQYKLSPEEYKKLFTYIRSIGFRCVEVYHSDNTPEDTLLFERLAEESGLLPTGGSDFHGKAKPDIMLGTGRGNIMVPKAILSNIGTYIKKL